MPQQKSRRPKQIKFGDRMSWRARSDDLMSVNERLNRMHDAARIETPKPVL